MHCKHPKVSGQKCSKVIQKSTYWIEIASPRTNMFKNCTKEYLPLFLFYIKTRVYDFREYVFLKLIFSGYNEDIIGNCNVPISSKE